MNRSKLSISVCLLLLCNVSYASELLAQLQQCKALSNASARLACYDATILSASENVAEQYLVVNIQSTPQAQNQPSTAPATLEHATVEAKPEQKFGLENRKIVEEKVDEIIAVVTDVSKSARGDLTVTLTNGQIWRQNGTEAMILKVGNEVRVRRGALDSFLLNKVGSSKSIRVKRVD